ncbi:hypoxanthine phosphoribosyltransferase [bacterium]|nr:hypoxanthine phosphoribosyltransferase [bacterium]
MTALPYQLVPIVSSDDLKTRLEGIVDDIRALMPTDDLVVIALLKGSFVFLADLIRLLHRHHIAVEVDFMTLASYGEGTESKGVSVVKDIETDIAGRPVLLVDDILDTGRTLKRAASILRERAPLCVKTCVLLDKPERRIEQIRADIVGFTVPNTFVVGYGLDYARRHRELPFIARLEPEPA